MLRRRDDKWAQDTCQGNDIELNLVDVYGSTSSTIVWSSCRRDVNAVHKMALFYRGGLRAQGMMTLFEVWHFFEHAEAANVYAVGSKVPVFGMCDT